MKLIIDAMSGDKAPSEIVAGALEGALKLSASGNDKIDLLFTGDRATVKAEIEKHDTRGMKFEIKHTNSVVAMCDNPLCVSKSKRDSSMAAGLELLKNGEGDAFISAGNTGALLVGSTLILKRIKGIKRAVIASTLPFHGGVLLLDSGANTQASPEELIQYALMGAAYAELVSGKAFPRVGLLNNGAEPTKGTETYIEAHKLLSETKEINFVGNIEGCDVPTADCDIIVCDGFTGNIMLKTLEGLGVYMLKALKGRIEKGSPTVKIGAALIKKELYGLKKELDSTEYGGAPILGASKPVIKAHGSSNARAISSAVGQAYAYYTSGACGRIADLAASLRATPAESCEKSTS